MWAEEKLPPSWRGGAEYQREADFVPTKIGPDGLYFPYCPFGPSKAVQNMPYRIENKFFNFRGADFDLTQQAPEGLYLRYYPFGASKAR